MWSAYEIERANHIATKFGLIGPVVEQPVYNLLERDFFEKELGPIFKDYNYGSTVFSPLATGLLTGKYSNGIPAGSRYDASLATKSGAVQQLDGKFNTPEAKKNLEKILKFQEVADELKVEMAPLALAFLLKNKNVSSVITGASKPEQLEKNIKAYEVLELLTDEIIEKIEKIFDNKPKQRDDFGRL